MEKTVSIDPVTAINLCREAFKSYAIGRGLDPKQEILISRWYLKSKRKGTIKLIGQANDKENQNSGHTDKKKSGGGSKARTGINT